jgi:hypothetical protein
MKRLLVALSIGLSTPASAQIFYPSAPNNIGTTWISVTCGTTSTPFGISAGQYLSVQVPPTSTQNVFIAWGGVGATPTTATTTATTQQYAPGWTATWGGGMGSCIVASGTQAITVGYK